MARDDGSTMAPASSAPHDAVPPLRAALRLARVEEAERSDVVAELRGAEFARLDILREAIAPVLAEVPAEIDVFDVGLVPGERPRLFLDMVAFVEMARDRRLYRLQQDTRHGRVTLAESERIEPMVQAITTYVARRLVERETLLAATPGRRTPDPARPTAENGPGPAHLGLVGVLHALVEGLGWLVLLVLALWCGWQALRFARPWLVAHGLPL